MNLVLLCPGQGGQHPRMFDRLAAEPGVQAWLHEAAGLLGMPLPDLAAHADRYRNAIAQPLVCAGALAHWQALATRLPAVVAVAGYSAGELAAHAIAGSCDASQCLQIARQRAALMDAAAPADSGLCAVLGLDTAQIRQLCRTHGVYLAIDNGPDHVVLGGLRSALAAACDAAARQGARVVALPVCVPAHTPLLEPAATGLADLLATLPLRPPRLRLLAGIDGRGVADVARSIASLSRQVAQTVRWQQTLEQAVELGGRVFLELGPGTALSALVRQLHPQLQARSVEDFQTLDGVAEWVEAACARA